VSAKALADAEKASLNLILEDLHYLFDKDEILQDEIDGVLQTLKSDEVKSYIQNLRYGSKPETALRESFIAGKSVLLKYLFGEGIPEVRSDGFIDYLLKDEMGRGIALELKPLFEAVVKLDKAGKPILEKLKQTKIVPGNYAEQILKYIREGEAQFVILTNLKEWFFYSEELSPKEVKYFCAIDFFDFVREYEVLGNLKDYLERKELESIRYELDKWFLQSLKAWVSKLSEIEFIVDDKRKLELIIGLINKFIFVQTLDDYGVIEFNWIRKRWNYHEQMWQRKGKLMVLQKFFGELDNWFYLYYDTELFRENVLQYIKEKDENINGLYKNLQLVLGLTYLQMPFGALKGIMQYNFRYIDEDVLGKAYETFLAGVRHDEGVYYTPKYITQYIAENTVCRVFDELLIQIKEKLHAEDFEQAKRLVKRFTSVSVLDPACGSGSFLIKAIRLISERYGMLNQLIDDSERQLIRKNAGHMGSLDPPRAVKVKFEQITEIRKVAGPKTGRELISRILVRHIHGNDLDMMAFEVAKVNIWLEAIKLSPKEFRYDRLPAETNYILPILGMNLCNGDSVFGLPEDATVDLLSSHRADIVKLSELRQGYIDNPMQPELADEVEKIKEKLRKDLDNEFRKNLEAKQLSPVLAESKPFHWALEFWHFYFDSTGDPLPENEKGADVVLGNPPYERIQVLKKKSPAYVSYLDNSGFRSATKNYDLAAIFIEKGVRLLTQNGEFGYIVTNKFIQADYGEGLRDFLSEGQFVRELIDFGDQQVFDDATTYTSLLFLKKNKNQKLSYAHVKKLERTIEQLRRIHLEEQIDEKSEESFLCETARLNRDPWVFSSTNEERILKVVDALPKFVNFRENIFQGITSSADSVYILNQIERSNGLVRVYSKSMDKAYLLETDLLKPILKGEEIKRWYLRDDNHLLLFPYKIENGKPMLLEESVLEGKYPRIWRYLSDNRSVLENRERGKMKGRSDWYGYIYRKNLEKYEQPKILTQVLASKASLALDTDGKYYFVGGGNAGGYGILLKKNTISLEYCCGLLNSTLLDWKLRKVSSRFRGGFYSYARRFLERLPIIVPQTKERIQGAERIEQLVERIKLLKTAQFRLGSIWTELSTRLKTDEQSFEAILAQDTKNLRAGATKDLWTSKVSFYPAEHAETLNKTYSDFKILGGIDHSSIHVVGIDEDNNEEQVYELEFEDRDLMLHFYHSLSQTLESRAKVKTLSQLFAKTMIRIVKEVNKSPKELTPNIIRKAKEDFEKWKAEKNITDVNPDIVEINNEIEDAEAGIDALVFKLYGLQENEINTIFSSLKTSPMFQAKVLQFFRKP